MNYIINYITLHFRNYCVEIYITYTLERETGSTKTCFVGVRSVRNYFVFASGRAVCLSSCDGEHRRLRQNALSRCRRKDLARKAFAWVAATWVVINCDKAQTRQSVYSIQSVYIQPPLPTSSTRKVTFCIRVHPHTIYCIYVHVCICI